MVQKENKMTTEQILELNEKRFVSHTTNMVCALCGITFKVSNRHLLPFTFEKIDDTIGRIWISCSSCGEKYDLGVCRCD